MKRYRIKTTWNSEREIEIEIDDDLDPMDPSNWPDRFLDEQETDLQLQWVDSAEEVDD